MHWLWGLRQNSGSYFPMYGIFARDLESKVVGEVGCISCGTRAAHTILSFVTCLEKQRCSGSTPVANGSVDYCVPQEVRLLIQQQNAIGWQQIFLGRFASKWQRIQSEYYVPHKRRSVFKRTGEMWQKSLILVIWDSWFDLWSTRNGEVHGKTRVTLAQAERREVDRQLTDIYAARQFMEPHVEALLEEDQDTQMKRTVRATKNWLAMAGPARNVRKFRKVSLRGVHSLRSYFPGTAEG